MTEGPSAIRDVVDRSEWEALLSEAGRSSLEQCWAYGEAHAGQGARSRVRRAVVERGGQPVAMVQVLERTFPAGLGLAQIIRGPVWLNQGPSRDVLAAIKAEYRIRRGMLLVWMPELPDGPESIAMMRAAGLRRMATGYSSAWIDLSAPEDVLRAQMHQKWRNALEKAELAQLTVQRRSDDRHLTWLLGHYETHKRKARYSGPSAAWVKDLVSAGAVPLTLRALSVDRPVAGVLFLRHGASATYYVGWAGEEGRHRNAHNLLLWRGLTALKESGVRWLDLGGVNAAAPGPARFKLGLGGAFFTLSGTYI